MRCIALLTNNSGNDTVESSRLRLLLQFEGLAVAAAELSVWVDHKICSFYVQYSILLLLERRFRFRSSTAPDFVISTWSAV